LELVAGLALILGVCYRGGVIWTNLLTLMFIGALSTAIIRGISIDCGCFKAAAASSESAWNTVWFDLALIVLTLQLFFSHSKRWRLSRD